MNPNPLLALNHLTVPCSFTSFLFSILGYLVPLERPQPYCKKGRKFELAAPSSNLKVLQEQQTRPQHTIIGGSRSIETLPAQPSSRLTFSPKDNYYGTSEGDKILTILSL